MNSREAIKYIEKNINDGIPKSHIFKELANRVRYQSDLFSYMGMCPSKELKTKYKQINLVLWITLLIILIIQGLSAIFIFSNFQSESIPWLILRGFGTHIVLPIALLYLLFQVWKFRGPAYRLTLTFSIFMLGISASEYQTALDWLVFAGPWLLAMVLSYTIMRKVFPYDRLFRGLDKKKLENELSIN